MMKKTWALSALAGLAVAAGSASAQVFASGTVPKNVLDNPTVTDVIAVSGGPVSITDVNVVFRMSHTFAGDIDVVLVGPGTTGFITLTTDNGSSGTAGYNTTRFDDSATTSITSGTTPFNNNFRPEATFNGWAGTPSTFTSFGPLRANLAGFNGLDSNGNWTLYIDDDASGDTGVLNYWSLEFNGSIDPQGPPPIGAPTNPAGTGTYSTTTVIAGSTPTNLRVTVTPGTNPASTFGNVGTGVTVNGTAIGVGTITLTDLGNADDDGIAGNNIWGKAGVIANGSTPAGTYSLPISILDNQGRSAAAVNMPLLTVVGVAPGCPSGSQPVSFTNVDSIDPAGDTTPGNAFISLGWTGSDIIDKIRITGRLQEINTSTFAEEARFRVRFSDSSFVDLQPFPTTGTGFTFVTDVSSYVSPAINKPVSSIVSVEAFDSFDDTANGVDARWLNLCFSYDALLVPTNPTGVGSATPNSGSVGASTKLLVTVTNGQNPVGTYANVGSGVTVDASAIDAGTVTLTDLGDADDDGIAGNGIWGKAGVVVGAGAAIGAQTLTLNILDDQARTGSNTFTYTVTPPPPACPPGSEAASFTGLISNGPQGDSGNSTVATGFTSSSTVTALHFSGRQDCDGSTGSFSSESRFRVNFSDSTFQLHQPILAGSGSDVFDVANSVMTLTTPRPANEIVSIETFDSFDDPGQDAVWLNMCVAWESAPTNPSGVGSHGNPAGCAGFANGDSVSLNVLVTAGTNPASTFANVGSGVTVNAAAIGGGSVTLTDLGGGNWGGSATVTGSSGGTFSLPFTILDDQGRNGAGNITGIVVATDFTSQLPAGATDFPGTSASGVMPAGALIWRIEICDEAAFSASTIDLGTTADTQLFLFDASGNAVSHNDDDPAGSGASSIITSANVSCQGIYYLALTGYNYDPINSDCALIWANSPFDAERTPDGPGAANPTVTGWTGSSFSVGDSYVLTLTGAGTPGSCGENCILDLTDDGNVNQDDVDCMVNIVAGDPGCQANACFNPDFNDDGNVNQDDVDAFINSVGGGGCP